MAKKGTTAGTAAAYRAQVSSARHGPGNKNLVPNARSPGKPTSRGRTAPLKGPDRGGV
ncbi:hypothetical protein CPT_Sonora_010 [Stenotrophomonas phage Sonora]|nr:hypothetical protein CPT_Sonora_010 [Stenotrophomonas phage Sonora]